jgi:Trk K+ transport system NAD-binding subunit
VKTVASELAFFLRGQARKNLKLLIVYCGFLFTLVLVYAMVFRELMWYLEGREYSIIAGIYWTITVMTTLGFGDITFHSEPGYIFAALVTISGVIFLLILLPFGMISLFIAPWIEERVRYRPSPELPDTMRGHVLIFGIDAVTRALMRKMQGRRMPFVVVAANHDEAFALEGQGLRVLYGIPTDSAFLSSARVAQARYIISNLSDPETINLCLTVRTLCETPIGAIAEEPEHVELLKLAGANQAIPLSRILGRYLATRATTRGAKAHVLDSFGKLLIAEIPLYGTPFVGRTLEQIRLRQQTNLTVIGLWERGVFSIPRRDSLLSEKALLVLAGTQEQLLALERLIDEKAGEDLVFVLGHGRIGCAAASYLDSMGVPFILVDQKENPHCDEHSAILGDATSRALLWKSGIARARGLIVTTNDDNSNIFMTLAARHSNPHIRIVARANREENVDQLYTAGADFVVSIASVGTSILTNVLENKESIYLSEGIGVFRRPLPANLAGMRLNEVHIRRQTGCSVVAIESSESAEPLVMPPPETVLEAGSDLILIGSPEQEEDFNRTFR